MKRFALALWATTAPVVAATFKSPDRRLHG